MVDYTLDEVMSDDLAVHAIPRGFEEYNFYTKAYQESFLALIREFYLCGKPIASVCTGAFPLAKSGVLAGKKGTTYNRDPANHKVLHDLGVTVVNKSIVVDVNLIISWNPATAMGLSLLYWHT